MELITTIGEKTVRKLRNSIENAVQGEKETELRFRNAEIVLHYLLFWDDGSSNPTYQDIVHVALYIGGNRMIEAPDRGLSVTNSRARTDSRTYFGAVRPTG